MGRSPLFPQTVTERLNVDAVCHHLALVAIDGATQELADTMTEAFELHLDGLDTDRSGYFALIDANHASFPGGRPPLDVVTVFGFREFVTARLEPSCLAYFRVEGLRLAEMWMTIDWQTWSRWLVQHEMT